MSTLEEAKTVWDAYQTYKACRKKLEQEQEQKQEQEQEQIKILKFFFPTPDFYPNPEAKKALKKLGLVHREGIYGVGYYADNTEY